jgi:LytS/YehU family sensor histidine kinase
MNKIYYHIIFWVFIFLYVFDYIASFYNFKESILYSSFEVVFFCTEFYINLFLLLPFVLNKKSKIAYTISLITLLILSFSIYYITGLNTILYDDDLVKSFISFVLNHSLFIFISYIVWFFNKYFTEKQLRLQLENEKLQTEMMLLKSQISPHFLFNALNNIYTLTLIKSDNAPKMLATLADILRYFLYEGSKKQTSLTSEIEIIHKYLEIQKFRQIEGMNNIIFNVSNENPEKQVPPLLFITLIENAFKHGDIIENKNGFVTIDLATTRNKIEFVIANSFQFKANNQGIGLNNLESQLKNLFGDNYQFKIEDSNSIYKVSLSFYDNKDNI